MSNDNLARPVGAPTMPTRTTRFIYLCYNPISLLGFLMVGIGLVLLVTFAVFGLIATEVNPYFGIVGYMILPGIFVGGLVVVPAGMLGKHWLLRRHARRTGQPPPYPRLDLNEPSTRAGLLAFTLFSVFIVLPVLGVSSYHGYAYTESTQFCGATCHSVMEPQATAHARSPHARVSCATCHIGEGASWFVKSKVSGLGQVVAVLRDSYPRPIPPAIAELRPARDTCEECHWPAQFFGAQLKQVEHFASDEFNTRRVVRMLLKTGGADESIGRVEGIHMHMLMSGPIEFVATDDGLQDVPWVRYSPPDDEAVVYRSDGLPHDAPPPDGIRRQIDCMDCHNRGAHHFRSPQHAVNLYLTAELIDPALPYIKREAVQALVRPYTSATAARDGIADALHTFYRTQYPQVWAERQAAVDHTVARVQEIYRQDFFPAMNCSWQTYPENIGHLNSPGCFRCHDGRHVNQHGVAIRSECNVCHTFLNPVHDRPDTYVETIFQHSLNLQMHQSLRCDQCHTGGVLFHCRECHGSGNWLEERHKDLFTPEGA